VKRKMSNYNAGRCSAATELPERTFARASRSLRSALADLERLAAMPLTIGAHQNLSSTLSAARNTIERISTSMRV
jgi:hypothetical protein